ncbi:MAG: hypothetical protein H7Y59_05320 [Anaerolineales bacterium]|nr:hypothetical protein [Anaerolineales bacterium]
MVTFDPIFRISETIQIEKGVYSLIGISLLVLVPTVIIGFTLTALNTFILKVFEGYVIIDRLPLLKNGYSRKAKKLIREINNVREQIEIILQKERKSASDKELLENLKAEHYVKVAEYDKSYPPLHAGIMPTKFGNILKASEAYTGTRYGIDAVEFWPRLLHVIPVTYRQSIDEARNELSFLVNMSALSFIFFVFCSLAVTTNVLLPGAPDWASVILNSFRYIASGLLALFSIWFFNKAALFSVGGFGAMIRSSYDLFRLDLLEQFRIKHPKNSVEEFQTWQNLGELIILGQESMEFKALKYEIKKSKER